MWYKEPGQPLFLFGVTMQNHSSYDYAGDNFTKTIDAFDFINRFTNMFNGMILMSDVIYILTVFGVLHRGEGIAKLALQPVTGRTHQLRVHCAYMGFPILGDPQYGSEASRAFSLEKGLTSQLLCAKRLEFTHPITGENLILESTMEAAL